MFKAENFFRHYFLILSSICLILTTAILVTAPRLPESAAQSLAATFTQGLLQGHAPTGIYTGRVNRLDFKHLQPGDILLGGKPKAAYGHFTHAGLYLGQGWVLEGYVDCGLSRQDVAHYHFYDWACILRVKLSPEEREKVLQYAQQQEFKPFYPAAFKTGERYWNCTKLIWAAYRQVGIDLDAASDLWISPDALYFSPYIEIITTEGEMPSCLSSAGEYVY